MLDWKGLRSPRSNPCRHYRVSTTSRYRSPDTSSEDKNLRQDGGRERKRERRGGKEGRERRKEGEKEGVRKVEG